MRSERQRGSRWASLLANLPRLGSMARNAAGSGNGAQSSPLSFDDAYPLRREISWQPTRPRLKFSEFPQALVGWLRRHTVCRILASGLKGSSCPRGRARLVLDCYPEVTARTSWSVPELTGSIRIPPTCCGTWMKLAFGLPSEHAVRQEHTPRRRASFMPSHRHLRARPTHSPAR